MLEMVRVTMIRSQYKLSFFSNMYLIGAIAFSVLLQVLVIYVPVMNTVFKTTALNFSHWIYIVVVMIALFIMGKVMIWLVHRE